MVLVMGERMRVINCEMTQIGENRNAGRKSCPSATLSTMNPTWIHERIQEEKSSRFFIMVNLKTLPLKS
jgi:hypothetical protein